MIKQNRLLGLNTFNLDQGSDEWKSARMGVITASRAHDIIKKGRGNGGYSESRKAYMLELIAQVCTGALPEQSSFKQAAWGHENEPLAREAYEAETFEIVSECGIVYRDDSLRCGISPDGLVVAGNGFSKGLEIKNPFTTKVHVETLLFGEIKPEYLTQCQYSMWVTGLDSWDFCSYDHRMSGKKENRLCIIPQQRDEEMMSKFDEEVPKFISEMDEHLTKLGFAFGEQWSKK